jgi:uncharacterized protein with FMN-binding domain
MRKALLIIFVIAILGTIAAYYDPLGHKTNAKISTLSMPASSSSSTTNSTNVTSSSSTSTQTNSSGYKDGTYQGTDYSSQYGDVQVSVIIQGGKITGVNFDQLTSFDSHSQEINSAAAPQLKSQTLSVQSASIDGVSGASYTTSSYEQSLQSALDKAKA